MKSGVKILIILAPFWFCLGSDTISQTTFTPETIRGLLFRTPENISAKELLALADHISHISDTSVSPLSLTEETLTTRIEIAYALFEGLGKVLSEPWPALETSAQERLSAMELVCAAYMTFLRHALPHGHVLVAYRYFFPGHTANVTLDPDLKNTPYLAVFEVPVAKLSPDHLTLGISALSHLQEDLANLIGRWYSEDSDTETLIAKQVFHYLFGQSPKKTYLSSYFAFLVTLTTIVQLSEAEKLAAQLFSNPSIPNHTALSDVVQMAFASGDLALALPGLFELLTLDHAQKPQNVTIATRPSICLRAGQKDIGSRLLDHGSLAVSGHHALLMLLTKPQNTLEPWSAITSDVYTQFLSALSGAFLENERHRFPENTSTDAPLGNFSPPTLLTLWTWMVMGQLDVSSSETVTTFRPALNTVLDFLNRAPPPLPFLPKTFSTTTWLDVWAGLVIETLKAQMAKQYPDLWVMQEQEEDSTPDIPATLDRLLALLTDEEITQMQSDPWHTLLHERVKAMLQSFLGNTVMGGVLPKPYASAISASPQAPALVRWVDVTLHVSRSLEQHFFPAINYFLNEVESPQTHMLPLLRNVSDRHSTPWVLSDANFPAFRQAAYDLFPLPLHISDDNDKTFQVLLCASSCQKPMDLPPIQTTPHLMPYLDIDDVLHTDVAAFALPTVDTPLDAVLSALAALRNVRLVTPMILRGAPELRLPKKKLENAMTPDSEESVPEFYTMVSDNPELKSAWMSHTPKVPYVFHAIFAPVPSIMFPKEVTFALQEKWASIIAKQLTPDHLMSQKILSPDDEAIVNDLLQNASGIWMWDPRSVYTLGNVLRMVIAKHLRSDSVSVPQWLHAVWSLADLQTTVLAKSVTTQLDSLDTHPRMDYGLAWAHQMLEGPARTAVLFYEAILGPAANVTVPTHIQNTFQKRFGISDLTLPHRTQTLSPAELAKAIAKKSLTRWLTQWEGAFAEADISETSTPWLTYITSIPDILLPGTSVVFPPISSTSFTMLKEWEAAFAPAMTLTSDTEGIATITLDQKP